jgi:hypothetical protein
MTGVTWLTDGAGASCRAITPSGTPPPRGLIAVRHNGDDVYQSGLCSFVIT